MGWFRRHEEPQYLADLADFSGAVDRLQDGDLLFLHSAWAEGNGPDLAAARAEAATLVRDSDRQQVAEDLDLGLTRWSGSLSRPTGYTGLVLTPALFADQDIRREALPALRDAGWAILTRDLLSPASYAALSAPWQALSEAPPAEDEAAEADRDGT